MQFPGLPADVSNMASARQVYPSATRSATTGVRSSAASPYTTGGWKFGNPGNNAAGAASQMANAGDGGEDTANRGLFGQPLLWWGVIAILLVGTMFASQKLGAQEGEFKNIRLSIYNVVVISLAAMVGFGFFKVLFGKVKIAGLSDFVHAV